MTATQLTRRQEISDDIIRLEAELLEHRNMVRSMTRTIDDAKAELDRAIAAGEDRKTREARRRDVQDLEDQVTPAVQRLGAAQASIAEARRALTAAEIEETEAQLKAAEDRMRGARGEIGDLSAAFRRSVHIQMQRHKAAGDAANAAAHRLATLRGTKLNPANQPYRGADMIRFSDVIRWME